MSKYSLTCLSILTTLSFANTSLENLFKDGRIIKAGTHTIQENKTHNDICKRMGGYDATDLYDMRLGSNTTDGIICVLPYSYGANAGTGDINDLQVSSLTTVAPSATLPFGKYWIKGVANYTNGYVGDVLGMSVGVVADKCGASGSNPIPVNSGVGTIFATCSYPSSRGARQSFMAASIEGANSTNYGTITLQ